MVSSKGKDSLAGAEAQRARRVTDVPAPVGVSEDEVYDLQSLFIRCFILLETKEITASSYFR